MYCPRCKIEYASGYDTCGLCKTPLVDSPASAPRFDISAGAQADDPGARPADESAEYLELLYTFNPVEISLIKSILDASGIAYHFRGEHGMFYEPAALLVRIDHVDMAEDILDELFDEEEE